MPQAAQQFVPKRGRPSAKQVAAIEQAILNAARELFFEESFDGVAMENVAAAAGVAKGTLYARYPSKYDLFSAVVKASVEDWSRVAALHDPVPSETIAETLYHHVGTIAQSLLLPDVRAFQRLLIGSRERFPELSRVMYETGYDYIVQIIASDIKKSAVRDGVPVRDAVGVGQLLVSAISGWQLQESAHHDLEVKELEAFGRRTVDLLLAARERW